MRRFYLAATIAIAAVSSAAPPATSPTTKPAKQKVSLSSGTVRMLLPIDWTLGKRGDDELSLQYKMGDGGSIFSVVISPQPHVLPDSAARVLRQKVIEGLKAGFVANHTVVLMEPHAEADDRFFVKIHDRIKEESHTLDQLHLYRTVGKNLIAITVIANTESPQEAKVVHVSGEEAALTIYLGPADRKPPSPKN